jgi:hypothetical protein
MKKGWMKRNFLRNQYLTNVNEPSPPLSNTQVAAIVVNELLARFIL